MLVFQALHLSEACAPLHRNASLSVSQVNDISMMGRVKFFSVTPNGQYAFTVVTRARHVLASMTRLVEVCARLEMGHNNDTFLQAWRDACSASPQPRVPTVADFVQIASSCLPGTYCGSFMTEQVSRLPDGQYSEYHFDRRTCDPGFFCYEGVRQPCPRGFVCPDPGLSQPRLCGRDASFNYNCFAEGLSAPAECPNGTLCGVPYLPALPAPPGFAEEIDTSVVVVSGIKPGATPADDMLLPLRTLVPCETGQWCGLGRSTGEEAEALLCPADTFCATPSVLEPTICNWGGRCTPDNCTIGAPYCPAGSYEQTLCPAGFYCSQPDSKTACAASLYCPDGSGVWEICPAKYYCSEDASEKFVCPDGFFCSEGETQPTKCNALSDCHCPGGCAEPHNFMSIPVLVLVPAGLYALFWGFQWYMRRRNKARDAAQAEHRRRRQRRRRGFGYRVTKAGAGGGAGAGAGAGASMLQQEEEDEEEAGIELELVGGGKAKQKQKPDLHVGVTPLLGEGDAAAAPPTPPRAANGSAVAASTTDLLATPRGSRGESDYAVLMASPTTPAMPRLSRPAQNSAGDMGFTPKEHTIDFKFSDLSFTLKSGAKVLQGVNGSIKHGRVTAVMGPSGA